MSNALTTAARPLVMDPSAKMVLMALCDMAREPDDPARPCEAWPPMRGQDGAVGLCDWTCLTERPIQKAVQRLVAAGLIERRQQKHGVTYTIRLLTPVPATGVAGTPVAATPVAETLTPVAGTPKASRSISKRKKTASSPSTRAVALSLGTAPPAPLPDGASAQQWADYHEMRSAMARGAKGRPWTAAAARQAVAKLHALAAAGNDPGAVLDQSVFEGWQGLFPIKGNSHGRIVDRSAPTAASVRGFRPDPALDLRRLALAELAAEERASADQAADRGPWPALPPDRGNGP